MIEEGGGEGGGGGVRISFSKLKFIELLIWVYCLSFYFRRIRLDYSDFGTFKKELI
jgi:hypothetical protein